jgi:hypothetical protein
VELAMQHLETATALISRLGDDGELSGHDRGQLNVAVAEAGVLVDGLTRVVVGESLEGEFARHLDQIEQRPRD